MESLKESDCQHTSNEDIKPDCLDSKELFKAMSAENDHSPQVKMEGQKLKFEPQDIKKEDGFWSEGMGLPQFDLWRESLKKGDCQHTSNEDIKPDCLDSKELFKAMSAENHHSPQVNMEGQKLKFEPQDIKKEDGFWSEGMGLSQDQFHTWRESFKDVHQHIDKLSSADSKELLESLPFVNCSISQVKMESQELKCEPQNNCGQDVIWSKGVEFSQNQFNASFESEVHQHASDKVAKTAYLKKPICVSQIKIENKKIKCEPRDMEEGEVMLSEALGHIKNERQELNKAERENIHKSGKRFVKTQIRLESSQMEIDHHFVRKQEKDVKPDSRNLEISPGLRNDLQNTFHVKHEREVNAECLGVKKEDPVWTVNSIKQEIYTDGRSDCRVSVDPIWASHSLQTQSKIANTDNICNDKKSFPKNVPECTKSVDFKAESYLKDEDPNWAFHCFSRRKKVMTEDTSHLKSPPPSNSQTCDEFQRPSNMIASDPQQEAPVPVQQIFPSGFSHQVRTAQDPSVQTATQISPMLNQKEVAQKRAAQQSFQYSQGGKCFSSHDTLKVPKIMHENDPYIVEQLKQLSFCRLCGEKQILHLQKGEVRRGKIILTPKCSSSEKQFWKCCSCKRGFRSQVRLNLHQQVHLRKLSKPKIKCPECEREFKNSTSLRIHSEVHIQGTVPCKLCDKVFRSETKLRSHHCRCHSAKTLACDKCEATFSTKASLFYHKAVHSDRRLFECSDCKSKFKLKKYLKTHMLIHTDERPFPCLQCPSRFRTKAHLIAHMGRSLGCGAHSGPHRKPGRKRNQRKQELSDTETSEEVSATDVESTSPSDSDTSDTEG
ncbi:zinc finger protein 583-like isoform X2 [Anguilla anguilla]|uniref:zinc finger protein 583-like isoform X2 n=1 Tax=Anguilla anguilla TaxID=7936 RepID=UPI0015AD7DF2|nr:zinc finger protein 583-like isoform X2 [Anguilla anguilla]